MTATITIGPDSLTDPSKQRQVLEYLEYLKSDPLGWATCLEKICTDSISCVEEHFFLLQVVEDFLKHRYITEGEDPTVREQIHAFLLKWIQKLRTFPDLPPAFLSNKMSYLFSVVFALDFPRRWNSFFTDLFFSNDLLESEVLSIFYLKTLLAIDTEVVDRDIPRSKLESERNTMIKDGMRDMCINEVAESCCRIMELQRSSKVQCLCLDVFSAYIDWIDLQYVANDAILQLISQRIHNEDTFESAVELVVAILQKGMPPLKKVALLQYISEKLNMDQLTKVDEDSSDDEMRRAGTLLNAIGLVLLECYSKLLAENEQSEASKCISALESKIPRSLFIFQKGDIEQSELVVDVIRAYVAYLIKTPTGNDEFFRQVVSIYLNKYVMPDDLEVDREGEDEIDFHEFRKQLRQLLSLERCHLIVNALTAWTASLLTQNATIRQREAVLNLFQSLNDVLPSTLLMPSSDGEVPAIGQMILACLLQTKLDGQSATVASRYERILAKKPEPIVPLVTAAFLDERGIAFPNARVRTRLVYLFSRFVKAHKNTLSSLVSEIITRLAPLLAVSPQDVQLLTHEDQAFVFEATSTLIVNGNLTDQLKKQYLDELCNSLLVKYNAAVEELKEAATMVGDAGVERRNLIIQFMCNIITYAGRISKGFVNVSVVEQCGCADSFLNLMSVFLASLSPSTLALLEPLRPYAHRLVVCLENRLLPVLPLLLSSIASVKDSQRGLLYVRRGFLQLLVVCFSNEIISQITSEAIVGRLVESACKLALCCDHASQKLAVTVLARACVLNAAWWESILRTCLQVPMMQHIHSEDAASTLLIHEVSGALLKMRDSNPSAFSAALGALLPAPYNEQLHHTLTAYKGKELDNHLIQVYTVMKQSLQPAVSSAEGNGNR
ncbi:hypothetical protein WR25_16000 [Diploscapter pachys]|uniref:Exportin-T n=1 Tax=Diploscapter pachys TaxID=2018661 RepID=A0A2A2KXS3_9BILA|nr:hypothetical protein WR25_16000 [Diploscapter pachys]